MKKSDTIRLHYIIKIYPFNEIFSVEFVNTLRDREITFVDLYHNKHKAKIVNAYISAYDLVLTIDVQDPRNVINSLMSNNRTYTKNLRLETESLFYDKE